MLSVQLSTPTKNRIVKQAIRHKRPFCTDESGAWCELAREPAIYQIFKEKDTAFLGVLYQQSTWTFK